MIVSSKKLKITSPSFIAFEGGNGVGKSTLLHNVAKCLEQRGHKVITTREPGGSLLGSELRTLVKERRDIKIDELAELFLFCADRAQHISEVILPALEKGIYVLTDRHWFSTVAFQGYGRGISMSVINSAISLAIGNLLPKLTVVVDLPISEAKKRMQSRQQTNALNERDKFEEEADIFQEKVRQGFLTLANDSKAPSVILDGATSQQDLIQKVMEFFD